MSADCASDAEINAAGDAAPTVSVAHNHRNVNGLKCAPVTEWQPPGAVGGGVGRGKGGGSRQAVAVAAAAPLCSQTCQRRVCGPLRGGYGGKGGGEEDEKKEEEQKEEEEEEEEEKEEERK